MYSGDIGNLGRKIGEKHSGWTTKTDTDRQTHTQRERARERERASLLTTSNSSESRSHSTPYYGNHYDKDI